MLKKWLRNKLAGPVYVDCYTGHPDHYKMAKIKPATKYFPQWWKNIDPQLAQPINKDVPGMKNRSPTMRGCVGFTDMFQKAFCLPMWCDTALHTLPAFQDGHVWEFSDRVSKVGPHPGIQRGDFLPEEHFQHFKLISPWHLKCEEEVQFLLFDPFWPTYTGEERALIPPGILNFKYNSATNVNLFLRKYEDREHNEFFKFNEPLVFLLPLTERKVILRHHLVDPALISHITRPQVSFVNAYATARKHLKQEEQSND